MGWFDTINSAAKGVRKDMGDDERRKIAADIVLMSSFGAAAVTIAPIPGSDFFLVTPLQAAMVMAVGRVYGRTLSVEESKHILIELGSVCGVGWIAQKGFATLSKILLPIIGGVLAGPWAFGVTYGMGYVAMAYFKNKDVSRSVLKGVYDSAAKQAKKVFSKEKLDEFKKKQGEEVEDFVRKNAEEVDDTAREPVVPKKKKKKKKAKRAAPVVQEVEEAEESEEDETDDTGNGADTDSEAEDGEAETEQ